jgi:hypothetical protein
VRLCLTELFRANPFALETAPYTFMKEVKYFCKSSFINLKPWETENPTSTLTLCKGSKKVGLVESFA